MELRHIRYFLEVAETLNFSRAAERLRVAQPALSKQVRDLEVELGGKLFDRTTTKVALTEMGHYFRQQTRKLVFQLDVAVTAAQQLAKGAAGTLKLGCDWRAYGWLPIGTAARRLHEMNPRLTARFIELPSHEHVAAVRTRSIDIGFTPSIFLGEVEDLELRSLFAIRLKVVLPEGHRLASRASLSLQDLRNERWLTLDTATMPGFRVIMAQILRFTPKFGLTTTSRSGLVAHVSAGHGIGFVAESNIGTVEPGVVAVDTDCTPIEFFAVSLKRSPSPLVAPFLDIVEELIAQTKRRPTRS